MTLDERLTRAAHEVVERLTPPTVDLDGIRARARSNRRRRTLLSAAAAATLTAVIAVGATVVANRDAAAPEPVGAGPDAGRDRALRSPTPEEPNPFPTSMTPEEVVNEPRAQLQTAAVAPGDPDTRISMWYLQCTRPCPDRGPSAFKGLALTTDGYETTTYLRPPFPFGVDLQVSSPAGRPLPRQRPEQWW